MEKKMSEKYVVFQRSCKSFEDLGRARKKIIRRNLTIEEARQMCANFNDNRTPAQIKAGTKCEFTAQ